MTSTYEEILIALGNLDYAEQLQLAKHILVNLTSAVESEEAEQPESFRKTLPKLTDLFREGYVKDGDVVYLLPKRQKKFRDQFAVLLDDDKVRFGEEIMSINEWARRVYEYKGVNIYTYVILDRCNCTLGQLRAQYIQKHGLKDTANQ